MSEQVYEYTHNAPEVYDTYRIVVGAAARLGEGGGPGVPTLTEWGIMIFLTVIMITGVMMILRKRRVA